MGKLHEILACEPDKKGAAEKILAETIITFNKKQDHFTGQLRQYDPVKDDDTERFDNEKKAMVTTVRAKLDYTEEVLISLMDILYQKEETNTGARSDLLLPNGTVLAEKVPATVLLNLENRFKAIRTMYSEIPTLTPDEEWSLDTTLDHTYKSKPKVTYKTQKVTTPLVLYPHMDKHPAQIKEIVEDKRQGTWTTTKWSGMLSPTEKSELLGRVDTLIQAVKCARVRANDQEAANCKIGKRLFDYINSGK
jgi:hypothetical protein